MTSHHHPHAEQVENAQIVAKAWPELPAPTAAFWDEVVELKANTGSATIHMADLYLSRQALAGNRVAIERLEQLCATPLAMAVKKVGVHGPDSFDLRQELRQFLLVGENAALRRYTGRGALKAWVGVSAFRAAINATRRARNVVETTSHSEAIATAINVDHPELEHMRDCYKADFQQAFGYAVRRLPARARTVLYQHLVQGLTVRDIGRIYGVHSSSVARWIVQARQELGDETFAQLRERLQATPSEVKDILALIRSRISLSLSRVLGDDAST